MGFLPNPFNIQPVQIPKLHELMDSYDQSFEAFISDEQIYVDWRDSSKLQVMNLQIETEKDEQWARLFDKSFDLLKEADKKTIELKEALQQNQKLVEENKLLKSKIFSASSEQSDQKNISNSNDALKSNELDDNKQPKQKKSRCPESYTGRTKLPEHLQRKEVVFDIPEDKRICACCEGKIHFIDAEESEKVTIIPKQVIIEKRIRNKYVCHSCDKFFYAEMPKTMLSGSNYDHPTFLADVAINRFLQAMPYYRIEQYYNSINVPFNRTTIANTMSKVADRLFPLIEGLKSELLTQNVIHADETTMQVLNEPDRKPQTKSFMWLYRSGKHEKNQITLFDYQQTRSGEHPKTFLTSNTNQAFDGFLVVDGYSGYNNIPNVKRIGCMAHVRRKFDEALKALPNNLGDSNAQKAINMIAELYAIESRIKDEPPDKIFKIRNELSVPLLNNLKQWLDEMKLIALPKMLFGKAINYALAQWQYVSRYTEDGELPIDNNFAERAIKQFVIGRKNWLFSNSVDGAYANAAMYSLVGTAIANGLDPYKYLLHVFEKFPNMERCEDISILFPWNVVLDKPELMVANQLY